MSTAKASNKKRRNEPRIANSDHLDLDLDLSKQSFAKSLSKSCGKRWMIRHEIFEYCENCLKTEAVKFQAVYENCLTGIISKYEEKKERLCARYEQLRKRERSLISEHEKGCADKIAKLEICSSVCNHRTTDFQRSDEDIPADD
ncbi:unnamed protein product [Malus baccata var. baccata]